MNLLKLTSKLFTKGNLFKPVQNNWSQRKENINKAILRGEIIVRIRIKKSIRALRSQENQ